MTSEFKKITGVNETHYVLETASSGATSSGSIASVAGGVGKVQKRGNLLAQEEKKEAPKPRNFVAKNAKMGGAGQHKDKKKAEKQGDVKHRKPFAEQGVAEGEKTMSRAAKGNEKYGKDGMRALAKAGRDGASEKKLDTIRDKHDNYNEEWSKKYKSSINCSHPKGFSQKAHCAGNKKHNESMTIEMTCEDCGMCETHGNLSEIKKGQKDSNGYTSCWSGYHAAGTKKSATTGKQVRNCVPNEGVSEDHEIQMASSELQSIAKNAQALLHMVRKYSEQEGLDAWQQSKITKAADYLNAVLQSVSGEQNPLEGVGIPSYGVGGYRNRGDDERHDLDDPELQRNRQEVTSYNITINGKPINPKPIFGRSATIAWGKEQVAAGADLSNAVISPVREGVAEGSEDPYDQGFSDGYNGNRKRNPFPLRSKEAEEYDEGWFEGLGEYEKMNPDLDEGGVEGDAYMESLAAKLAEKIPKNAPVDVWIKDFEKSNAPQFRGKNLAKRKQMAIAASYGAKNPSKKK
jgi:hypothetical protein